MATFFGIHTDIGKRFCVRRGIAETRHWSVLCELLLDRSHLLFEEPGVSTHSIEELSQLYSVFLRICGLARPQPRPGIIQCLGCAGPRIETSEPLSAEPSSSSRLAPALVEVNSGMWTGVVTLCGKNIAARQE